MKNQTLPFLFTLAGYAVCAFPMLFVGEARNFIELWPLGFLLHFIGFGIFASQKHPIWKSLIYLLLPIPLGFFLTLGMILICNGLFGWWH
ncbi:MAG: hypothetical protein MRZ79_05835 [Bacteroidia bacterium]|nr:hypothetical protein [Bacteroidia bacterium]